MSNEIIPSEKQRLERYYSAVCRGYGVTCKILTPAKCLYSDEKEQYLVFGIKGVPDDLNVKDIYIRNERSNILFYPDYFVVKLDGNTTPLGSVDAAISYCRTAEFLRKLYKEHGLALPEKIRGDEIRGLKEYNVGRKNKKLPSSQRTVYEQGIKKFFKDEKKKGKLWVAQREFMRTDKFDRKANRVKMFLDFLNRNSSVTSLEQLHETNDDLKTATINEHEVAKFKEEMARLYPDVLFSLSSRPESHDHGLPKKNRNKPVGEIQSGSFGRLVTNEAYSKEVEKRFATEGYDAILDLNPVYYETRQLTYKEIDEPFVAAVLNSIRFAYAKSNSLQAVNSLGYDVVSYLDVPLDDMMNFVSLAKANNVTFYLDYYGKFGTPNLDNLRVVYSPKDDETMGNIATRMITEKVGLSHIETPYDDKTSSLDNQIDQAQLQLRTFEKVNISPLRDSVPKQL